MSDEEHLEFRFKESDELANVKYREERDYESYSKEEHSIWRELFDRQTKILKNRAVPEFFSNLDELKLERNQLPRYEELSDHLKSLSGWEVVPVPGLIPGIYFFEYLANKKFPVTNWIRDRKQFDYIVEPDYFHDCFGHLPMIADPVFSDYLQHYGREALKAEKLSKKTGFDVLENLARTYWVTVEFGLIKRKEGLRIYGAGIQSSKTESIYSLESPKPRRIQFELERAMRTEYDYANLQTNYFVIDDYEFLLQETSSKRLEEQYKLILENPFSYNNTIKLDSDVLVPPNAVRHFY